MKADQLRGVFAPVCTPFDPEENLDEKSLAMNMERYAQSGIQGYLALGSNGENKSLLTEEKFTVLKIILKGRAKGQAVIAGCVAESTRETLCIAQKAQDMGCDFIALLPPSYFKRQMTDDALLRYFTDVADKLSVPCLLYNAPGFAGGLALSESLIRRAAAHPNILGMKDSSAGNIEGFLLAAPAGFAVLAGSLNNFLQGLLGGAYGGVLSLANAFPSLALELYRLFTAGEYQACFALNRRLLSLNRAISGKGGVASVKAAMDFAGFTGGIPRRPLLPLAESEREALWELLSREDGTKGTPGAPAHERDCSGTQR